jgi:transcriptional regulator with XRE-family HTH domain
MTDEADFAIKLGTAMRDARLDAGYTQEELARALHVTPATIARYELGIRRVSVSTLLQIAHALGQPLSQLVPGANQLEAGYELGPDTPLRQAVRTVVKVMEQRPDIASKVLQIIETSLADEQGRSSNEAEW